MPDRRAEYLLIISCSKRKIPTRHKKPAIEVYDGPVYRAIRRRFSHVGTLPVDIYIVSAEYGLIEADHEITSYEHEMTLERALELRVAVATALARILQRGRYAGILINLGARYRVALGRIESIVGDDTRLTFAEGRIGQRTSQTVRWLEGMLVPVV